MLAVLSVCRALIVLLILSQALAASGVGSAVVQRSQLVLMLPGAVHGRPLVLRLSQWTTRAPRAELLPYDHEHVELLSSSVRIANHSVDAHLQFKVSDSQDNVEGAGKVDLQATLLGTHGTGRFHGQFAGSPVEGAAQAAIAFDHAIPEGVRSLRLWLPDLTDEVRGVLLWGNGAGGDSRIIVLDERLQAFAAANRLAIVGTCRFGAAIRQGEGQQLIDSLRAFADITDHREIANAPLLFSGHSNGGQMAYEFNAWMPSRVIAFSVWRGGSYESYQGLSKESLATPAVLSAGERDLERRVVAIRKLFDGNRPLGASWSLLVEQNKGHERGNSLTLFLVAFQSALRQRLPKHPSSLRHPVTLRPIRQRHAWLADNGTWKSGITAIHEARTYSGDTTHLSWLPDEDTAYVYRGLATYDNPLKLERVDHPPTYRVSEPVVLECTAFSDLHWNSVTVYDGAKIVGAVTSEHPRFSIKGPHRPGAHAAVLVGELPDGTLRTSIPVEWVVWPQDRHTR